jgi:hypothetical protein
VKRLIAVLFKLTIIGLWLTAMFMFTVVWLCVMSITTFIVSTTAARKLEQVDRGQSLIWSTLETHGKLIGGQDFPPPPPPAPSPGMIQ